MDRKAIKVCVLIPYYNNRAGLESTILSISSQRSVHIIVVNDGSENVPSKTELACLTSNNIEILNLKENRGIEHALNVGIRHIKANYEAEFIARIDCGDLMTQDRLDIQCSYMEDNSDIDLVGSWGEFMDDNNNVLFTVKVPAEHASIARGMVYKCSLIHPTVMIRVSAIDKVGLYNYKYRAAEDYDFFYRFIKKSKVANIPMPLTKIHYSKEGISKKNRRTQLINRMRVVNAHNGLSKSVMASNIRMIGLLATPPSIIDRVKQLALK